MRRSRQTSKIGKMVLLALAAVAMAVVLPGDAGAAEDWAVTVFGAFQLRGDIWQTFYAPDFHTGYGFAALAVSRKFYSPTRHIDLELEGQFVKHLVGQYHEEFNGLLVARWLTFPWNRHVPTTFAAGNGLSYAVQTPEWESTLHGKASQLLNCMMFELTFSLPDTPRWSLVWRVHHRSGVFGLFSGVEGASNAMGLGLKYRF
jgi:hypothetical protein